MIDSCTPTYVGLAVQVEDEMKGTFGDFGRFEIWPVQVLLSTIIGSGQEFCHT